MRWPMKLALISLLVAWGLFGLGAFLIAPVADPPELADYRALWRARDGLPESLEKVEALAAREDGVGWQAQILAGRAHIAAGDPTAGAEYLRSALSLRATRDLRAELALALEEAKETSAALAEWKKLLPRPEAVAAVTRLEPDPIRLAFLLNGAGRCAEALALVRSTTTAEGRLARARALVGLGRWKEALPEFEAYLAQAPKDSTVRKEYGRALEQAGERERALAAYRALGATAAYQTGRLLETMGKEEEAVSAYLLSKDGEARWRGARLLESKGEEERALGLYLELARGSHRVRDDAALRAHLIYVRRGKVTEAAEMAKLFPPAFNWLLGTYRAPALAAQLTKPRTNPPQAVRVADLLLNELAPEEGQAWAQAELEIALRAAGPEEKVAIGEWFTAHGDYYSAYKIGAPLLSDRSSQEAYALAYPRAWPEAVARWATAYGVDPLLVLAVIREESNFSPTAVSSSDARGLMQLLPSTAKWIAEAKLGELFAEERLTDPDFNIRLGTWYLGYLIRLFDSDVAKAVAAYNGGQGNLERWTAAAKVTRPADLPGALVSSETREYLAKVLNSWLIYQWLYPS